MKNREIVKLIVVMAFLVGCASQPTSPPSPAATKPVAAKKQQTAVVEPPVKQAPAAAIESHSPEIKTIKPIVEVEDTQPTDVSTGMGRKPETAGSSNPEPPQRRGAARGTVAGSEPGASHIHALNNQALKPPGTSKKVPTARPIAKPEASAAAKAPSRPTWRSKAAVAKPTPETKKPSVPKRVASRTPEKSKRTSASRTAESEAALSQHSPAEDKAAAKTELEVEERANKDADASSRTETQLAMITKQPPAATPDVDVGTWVFDEEHLPRTLPGGWVLDIRPDQLGSNRRCLLYSARMPIFDGYDKSWIRLQVTTDAIVINTNSYVDTSYPGQGLRIDSGELIPLMPNLLDKKTTYTKKPALAAMANGTTLTVSLGFWPTWPVTKTQSATIDLTGFKRAYAALRACSAAQ